MMSRWLPALLCLGALCLVSCGEEPATAYAAHFCDCSKNLADAMVQQQNNAISAEAYTKIRDEHLNCMESMDDPLETLTPEEQEQFKKDFLREVKKNCPNIGRNFGYNLDF